MPPGFWRFSPAYWHVPEYNGRALRITHASCAGVIPSTDSHSRSARVLMKPKRSGRVRVFWNDVVEKLIEADTADEHKSALGRITRHLREKGFADTTYATCNPVLLWSITGNSKALAATVWQATKKGVLEDYINHPGSLHQDEEADRPPRGTPILFAAGLLSLLLVCFRTGQLHHHRRCWLQVTRVANALPFSLTRGPISVWFGERGLSRGHQR